MSLVQRLSQTIFIVLVVLTFGASDTQRASAQQEVPFDLFGDSIENITIYRYLESQGATLVESQPEDAVISILDQLEAAAQSSDIEVDSLSNVGTVAKKDLYRHMVKSSLYFGVLYDCGRCDRTHASFSGAVAVSEDGLILTNYHVLKANEDTTEGYMAMAWDGQCFAVDKVVAANKSADVALVQLKTDGYKFHAAPIAMSRPRPMDSIRIVSHPAGEFFVLTEGEVSRYSKMKKQVWMEVTADFAGGSSGSGVFNDQGEVVGIVSRIHPISRGAKKVAGVDGKRKRSTQPYVEMILRRCVPLKAIHECFAGQD